MEYVLTSNQLYKNYGHFRALSGLSMKVPKGSIYGVVGKNGAGKTTLIRIICGLQSPSLGEYSLYGTRNPSRPAEEWARSSKRRRFISTCPPPTT